MRWTILRERRFAKAARLWHDRTATELNQCLDAVKALRGELLQNGTLN